MSIFHTFAEKVTAEQDAHLLDFGPEEQAADVVKALQKLDGRRPLREHVEKVNAFGFGTALTCFATGAAKPDEVYLQLFPLAEAIGIPIEKAAKLAELKHSHAVRDQRRLDEKTGGLGWDYLNDWISLDLWLILDDPEANPDAGGRRWTHGSDWLVSLSQITELVLLSPWGKEFMDNATPMFSHGFKLAAAPGNPVAEALASDREGISEEEARRRAFRGPSVPGADQ